MTTNLLEFDLDGLAAFCQQLGEKRFRATQLFRWIHQRGASDFDAMSDLAKALRDKLKGCARVEALPVISEHVSSDGTVKWLFDVGDGNAVEAVFIPEDDRGTLCISSQAGCAVGCRFCSTGHQGFSRNLTTGEIVAQLWFAEHSLRQRLQSEDRVISNVVMMGMGEPLQNYSALVPALRVMLDDHGYGLSRRRVTVSTSGVVPMMDRLSVDCPVALAVSLHAPNDPLRDNLVPLNRKYPLAELMAACLRYLPAAPRDFITFEYCMLDGVNDQPEHAQQLLALCLVQWSLERQIDDQAVVALALLAVVTLDVHVDAFQRKAALARIEQQGHGLAGAEGCVEQIVRFRSGAIPALLGRDVTGEQVRADFDLLLQALVVVNADHGASLEV